MREARLEKGLTLKQLGEKLGVSESYCSAIESGVRQKKMDLALAMKLSQVLKVPIKRILHEEAKLRLAQDEDNTESVR